jgi:MFS family permease
MRVITGAGEAVVMPASYRWMRNNFKEAQAGLAVGIFMLGTKFGPAIGAPIAAWLILKYDWKLMFTIIGLVGLFWLIPWMLFVKDDKPTVQTEAAAKRNPTITVPIINLVKSPVIWGTLIINFCYNYFVFYCMTWMPAYFVEARHLSLTKMGLFSFFSFLGIAIVALVSGWAADLLIARGWDPANTRKGFIIAGFVIACTELLGVRAHSPQAALAWAVVSLSGLGLATANHLALCRLTLIPAGAVGLVTGIQMVATSIAGIVAPLLSGWLKEKTGGYEGPMEVIFFFLVIGALTCLILLRAKWAPRAVIVPATG